MKFYFPLLIFNSFFLFNFSLCNDIFPMIPGSECGINPVHSTGYLIQFSQKSKNHKNNNNDVTSYVISVTSNHTFHINTTNMNKKCTPECYINCQVQFLDLIQEKFCIINVCKCDIIDEKTSISNYKGKKKGKSYFGFFLQNDFENNNNSVIYNKYGIIFENWVYILFIFFLIYEYVVYNYFTFESTKNNKEIYKEMENINLYQKLISEEPIE